jgi:hypothetical protein
MRQVQNPPHLGHRPVWCGLRIMAAKNFIKRRLARSPTTATSHGKASDNDGSASWFMLSILVGYRPRFTPSDRTLPARDFALFEVLDFDNVFPAVFKSFLLGGFSGVDFLAIYWYLCE